MREAEFLEQLKARICEERFLDLAFRPSPVQRGEMATGEEICDGGCGEH
jgi:hypothetical protein